MPVPLSYLTNFISLTISRQMCLPWKQNISPLKFLLCYWWAWTTPRSHSESWKNASAALIIIICVSAQYRACASCIFSPIRPFASRVAFNFFLKHRALQRTSIQFSRSQLNNQLWHLALSRRILSSHYAWSSRSRSDSERCTWGAL